MENKELTPSESLALITRVISEAKTKFRENGIALIFIGTCCFIASLLQYILLQLKYYKINYYPYFIMPLAGIIVFFYYKQKIKTSGIKNIITQIFNVLGIVIGINLIISGFLFWKNFGNALLPFILIMFSIWPFLLGIVIRNIFLIVIGIAINIVAYISFFIDISYHPLILSIISLLGIVLPGIIIYFSRKNNYV